MKILKEINKAIGLMLIVGIISTFGYMNFEPELTEAITDDIVVTQSVTQEISISTASDVTMSSIGGMTGGTGTGNTTWTVTTNSSSGFTMSLKSNQSDGTGLTSGSDTIGDYTPTAAGVPDYNWGSVAASASEFGFTVEPATAGDTVANFRDNGTDTCNTGANQTADKCWLDFNGSTEIPVISRSTETASGGEAEVVKFQTEIGSSKFQPSGSYTATITATAVVQ